MRNCSAVILWEAADEEGAEGRSPRRPAGKNGSARQTAHETQQQPQPNAEACRTVLWGV